ncbi:sugar transporter [Flexivirga endophytica]|uniref:Sugar transporter n=1 Tax=Flexivirga endophytica TaxID=1849103 RepID=A0A916T875_9MICO|nr:MFS transporter [Flexivirga endophytica]GGB35546.1 sugar transporter [Flexivirga endophytica]GHB43255.1 sugar transporter [Flexivirga endophytica]
MSVQTGTITTKVPARLDRLPWAKFHWRVVIGLGSVWILDGLEVTMVGNVAARMTEGDSGISITSAQIGMAGAIYVVGACVGALFFGQLTDRFGRKKLFMLTLGVYITATVLSAFAFAPWYFFFMRFFTGSGIGGEYSAINSAIDELIPARVRGRIDLIINGTYWAGAAGGAAVAIVLLNKAVLPADLGWRLAFGLGAVLGLLVLLVRRHVPESPRWLFIHGREDEAERIVGGIEQGVEEETGQELSEPGDSITVRQRQAIPFREIAKVAFTLYPKRAILGLSLFVGQAFLYNGITFDLGTLLGKAYNVSSDRIPIFFILYAVASFLGPVLLGRLFDTVGRKPMIAISYLGSAAAGLILAWVIVDSAGGVWGFEAMLMVTFFLASSGASAAYLTVSEIFPMETRALAIAFFYAVGTAAGGIAGPLLFGRFIDSGDTSLIALGFIIGAVVMAVGGVIELFFGVNSEGKSLESIATPLTAEGVKDGDPARDAADGKERAREGSQHRDEEWRARDERIRAMEERRRREQTTGAARYRPGPGRTLWSPRMSVSDPTEPPDVLDDEIESIARALADRGALNTSDLFQMVGGRYWGPGRFRRALREAVAEGRVDRLSRALYGPPAAPGESSGHESH